MNWLMEKKNWEDSHQANKGEDLTDLKSTSDKTMQTPKFNRGSIKCWTEWRDPDK